MYYPFFLLKRYYIVIYKYIHLPEKVQLLSIADGKCKVQFTVAEEHLNPYGTMHGGFTSTVIDVVSSYALTTYKPDQYSGSSVDLHVT